MGARKATLLMALALACLASACLAMSIDSEPVKVTHRNSGPRYDIEEEPDRAKLAAASQLAPQASEASGASDSNKPTQQDDNKNGNSDENSNSNSNKDNGPAEGADQMPIGHVSIRRIFLVPVMRPERPDWQEEQPAERQEEPSQELPSMFARPFWPFLTPARPTHPAHHLFGADEASRSPSAGAARPDRPMGDEDKAESGGEREEIERPGQIRPPQEASGQPMLDPLQMMIEMMQQAINGHLAPTMPNSPDLNTGASTRGNGSGDDQSSDERPKVPSGADEGAVAKPPSNHNETREDVVEIEGKKYLRKTVINRHVGENIVFMTKRLIFVPLNETETGGEQQTTPAATTTTTAGPVAEATGPTNAGAPREEPISTAEQPKPAEEATTSTTTTEAAAASDENKTSAPAEATTEAPGTTTTTKGSIVERVGGAIERAAERLVERVSSGSLKEEAPSTTAAPAS